MNVIIFDTEFLSLSKKQSDYNSLIKYKNRMFPEIFQFSFLEVKLFADTKIKKKYNYYLKTKKEIPLRLKKLTNLTKNKILKAISFKEFASVLSAYLISKKKNILICNGSDIELLKLNLNKNKIILNINVKYVNLRKISQHIDYKPMNTYELKKNISSKLKVHDAINDCKIIFYYLGKIKRRMGLKKFNRLINNFVQIKKI